MEGIKKTVFLGLVAIFAILVIIIAVLAVFNYEPTSIGKGYINICKIPRVAEDPDTLNFWETHNAEMYAAPLSDKSDMADYSPIYTFPACDNLPVKIREYQVVTSGPDMINYSRVTLYAKDGNIHDGWIATNDITIDNLT
jgi:hypothetical protein